MFITNEIASITVLVPGGSDTRTTHRVIPFNVYKEGQKYRAIALIGNEERRLACLPEELSFHFIEPYPCARQRSKRRKPGRVKQYCAGVKNTADSLVTIYSYR